MSDELLKLRSRIDQLDEEILARLAERARSAQRIGEIKQGNLYRPEREAQVLRRLADANPGPLPDEAVQRIFREIMSACLALEQPLRICGEVKLRIHQHLLSRADGLGAARRLYSHAQSLAQCHEWLNRNLATLPRVPVASNAEAARLAAEDPESCAIAGEAAAELYGLNVLATNIEDDPNNTTRFLVIARHDAGPSGCDKTSLVLSALNRPGAMHALLEPLARHGVDMTKLQSRPARGGLWEYVFYVDFLGHRDDPAVAQALLELNERAAFVKVLGSYPVAAV